LTFADPGDYDLFEQPDRVSIVGLSGLGPGRPVTVVARKPDGRTVSIEAHHSLSDEQVQWFKAGSALNALK